MGLPSGSRLGPYEILSSLGAGGMGEVYRARDTRLKRDVAVKVLPERFSREPEALSRFEREALAVAELSHPGIVSIFDFGESEGVRYAVAELLEGETLRDLVLRGPLPPVRALDVARQVADALAAAHEKGIVHRDLKPENVFLTRDGHTKILDFGLARREVVAQGGADTRTPAVALTGEGVVLGTFAYMSPEQARGLPADHRSDQFSLGIVLYEMLSGRRPFQRESAAETLAAVIREEPEPLAPAAPDPVRWLLERCLAKDPAERYDSTRDLARELKTLSLRASEIRRSGETPAVRAGGRRRRILLAAAGAALLLGGSVAATLLLRRPPRSTAPATRFEVRLPEGFYLASHSGALDLSRDGRLLVFSAFAWKRPYDEPGEPRLFLRPLEALEARPIPGTEGGTMPALSPDGRRVAFASHAGGKALLRTVPVAGGPVETVCECEAKFGIAWAIDDTIVFAGGVGPLRSVPAAGGTPAPVTQLDIARGEVSHRLPHFLPDGRTLLYTALESLSLRTAQRSARIWAGRPGEKERTLLVDDGSDGRWSPPGNLVFAREGRLYAAPFDAEERTLRGKPVVVLDGVRHVVGTTNLGTEVGAAHVAVASTGLLAWGPGSRTPPIVRTPAWVGPSGSETPLEGGPSDAPTLGVRVSPDGGHVLLTYVGLETEVLDLDRRRRRRVTFGASPVFATWGPGPDRFTFVLGGSKQSAILARRLDSGPDDIETVWSATEPRIVSVGGWSRDGKTLAFVASSPGTRLDVWLLERGSGPRPFVATRFDELWPDISPDGRWLLYASNASGRTEVFARPLSGEGSVLQVSTGGGSEPLWSRDGRSVSYWQDSGETSERTLFRARVTNRAGTLSFGIPEQLFSGSYGGATPGHGWDVSPDGRFLVRKVPDEAARRLWWEKILSNRVVLDTGGLAHLLAEAKPGP